MWDLARVGRIATNLIGNAVNHGNREGGVRVQLDGRAAEEVRLVVHNQGAIPSEMLPRIFEPFRRGPERRCDGLGLGLFIVREIARAHGGDVSVTSTSSDGTRFEVRLPRTPRHAPVSAN
jgi:signal transduction histidine kinase